MKIAALLVLTLTGTLYAIEESAPAAIHIQHESKPMDVARAAYEAVHREIGDIEWSKFVIKAQRRYNDFAKDYDTCDIKRFLDDKLIMLAPGVISGKGERLREFAHWLALYDFFAEPVPHYIADLSDQDRADFEREMQKLDWARMAKMIKEKQAK
jgi:hypothetical protein